MDRLERQVLGGLSFCMALYIANNPIVIHTFPVACCLKESVTQIYPRIRKIAADTATLTAAVCSVIAILGRIMGRSGGETVQSVAERQRMIGE